MPISKHNQAKYGKDWKQFSARIRFERAGGMCECAGECGGKHEPSDNDRECYDAAGIAIIEGRCHRMHKVRTESDVLTILTVAHLCHDESCRDESHVKAMCQACHLRYDAKHHAKNARVTREKKQGLTKLF